MFQITFQCGLRMCHNRAGNGTEHCPETQFLSERVHSDGLALVWNCIFEFSYILLWVGKHGRLGEM